MSSESETQTQTESQTAVPSSGSLEERLLKLDAKSSKKALHDSRTLKRLGIVFIVLGALHLLFMEPFLFVLPTLPGIPKGMHDTYILLGFILLPLVVILPSFGVTLRTNRSNAAKWLFRIVALLGVVGGVLEMIQMVRETNIFGFIGELVSVLISIRLVVITYNDILFGPNPPSHNQIGYVRSKWKAGQKPDHIPEHVHKPPKYAKLCFFFSFLMIPYGIYQAACGINDQMNYSKAKEYYESGRSAFEEAGRSATPQEAMGKYGAAYYYLSLAASDPKNEDVHVYLGLLAARGLGCAKDEDKAFKELTRHPATTNNYPDAQYELALLYLYGRGTDRDVAQAALLLKSAAQKGQRAAMELLGYDMSKVEKAAGGEDSLAEPDYGGMTVEQYLEKKVEKESLVKTGD